VRVHARLDACLEALGSARLFSIETSGTHPYSAARFRPGDALLFGAETRGLTSVALALVPPERQLMIPMRAGNRSLNLSNAVALVIYEAWRQNDFAGARPAANAAASRGDH
jgi:tRNA (cytidine/uridine-2'-O-)-methyltransferase